MDSRLVGDVLKARREELNISLEQAATTTNMRARMIETFENNDYANYPAIGYAQGMLSSYARFLKLDPRPVVEQINVELSDYAKALEIQKSADAVRNGTDRFGFRKRSQNHPNARTNNTERSEPQGDRDAAPESTAEFSRAPRSTGSVRNVRTRPGTGSFTSISSSPSRKRVEADSSSTRPTSPRSSAQRSRPSSRASRNSVDDRINRTPEVDVSRHGTEPVGKAEYRHRSFRPTTRGAASTERSHTRSRTRSSAPVSNESILSRIIGTVTGLFSDKRSRLILLAAVLLIVAVLVAASILISTASNQGDGIIAATGGDEATTSVSETDSNKASATITTANGNPLTVSVDVAGGSSSLITVTCDDNSAYNGTAVGPWHRDFQVTESFSAVFGNPDSITVSENGNAIDVVKQEDGSGKLDLTVKGATASDTSSTSAK